MTLNSSNRWLILSLFVGVLFYTSQCSAATGHKLSRGRLGLASYYHDRYQGKRTASGEIYRKNKFTAAHKTLPFGTILRVTNVKNKRSVIVRVNDRGRLGKVTIDLSKAAARKLKITKRGIARVRIEVIRARRH